MTGSSNALDLRALLAPRHLLHPSTLVLLAANLLPLVGVLAWHWDAFLLLMLYWTETAVVGVWTMARIGVSPAGAMGPLYVNGKPTSSRAALVVFLIVHSTIFMAIHFVFLWALFSADWAGRVHGVGDFVDRIVVDSGMWAPLGALFIGRGVVFLFDVLRPDLLQSLVRTLFRRTVRLPAPAPPGDPGTVLIGFYGRIMMMQVAIILGAVLSFALGTIAPLVLLIAIKTVVDVGIHVAVDMGR